MGKQEPLVEYKIVETTIDKEGNETEKVIHSEMLPESEAWEKARGPEEGRWPPEQKDA